jgi:hypothetical protein
MKSKFLVKTAASVACLVAASVVSANATMTLTLDDGAGHTLTLNDSGSGMINFNGELAGSVWNANIDVALTKPILGGQFNPQLDVSIQSDGSTAAGTLTITAISTGFGPLGYDVGRAVLNGGGANAGGGRSLTAYGLVNGGQVVSIGPFTSGWSGSASANASGLSSTFSIGERIVITHNAANLNGPKGDISLSVPEPTTMVAGAMLLLPFGASTLRCFRKNRTA